MNIEIYDLAGFGIGNGSSKTSFADNEFKQAIENAVNDRESACGSVCFDQKSFIAISPKFEKKIQQDPELAREIAQKLENITSGFKNEDKNRIVVIDRSGEITQYSTKSDKRARQREYESIQEAAKARLRKKARLDAYFKIVQRISIKRKLIEQENAKRPRGKNYRLNASKLEIIAKSILQQPGKTAPYNF